MPQYRRRDSAPFDAIQFTGGEDSASAVALWAGRSVTHVPSREGRISDGLHPESEHLTIRSLPRSYLRIDVGEWVIKTPHGTLGYSGPASFDATYEEVPA